MPGSGARRSSVDHAVGAEELLDSIHERRPGYLAERDPGHRSSITSRARVRSVIGHGHGEIENDEVISRAHAFSPTEQRTAANLESGLLAHLTLDRVRQPLARFHVSPWDGPPSGLRLGGPL